LTGAREGNGPRIGIQKLRQRADAEECAHMMADLEPWITLRRDFDASFRMLTDPEREVYLAIASGEIAGFVMLNAHGSFPYLQSVCVASQWRNKGIGTLLLDYAEKRLFSETPNVFVCVSSFHRRPLGLFERRGYEVIGELKNWIASGYSQILLRKTIGPLTGFNRDSRDSDTPFAA
jgi:ribosomal-protein-alanine N-acetyltransferase